jgi:IS30 family transposase
MTPYSWPAPAGRYLSLEEREDIAILHATGHGVRAIASAIGRSPSTISRELRRNAATRGGTLDYRVSVAHWKAELFARRPKAAKLAENERLREYVRTAFRAGSPCRMTRLSPAPSNANGKA